VASNSVASLAFMSSSSCPHWLAPFSCSSRAELTGFQLTNFQPTIDSIWSLGTDHMENSSPNSSSIVASRSYHTGHVKNSASQLLHCCVLQICCLAVGMFAEPFPSNDRLCWLHSSCLEQICHIAPSLTTDLPPFLLFQGDARDISDWPCLPSPWFTEVLVRT
jgi:hypothetical protein